jgi:hypothetical protein
LGAREIARTTRAIARGDRRFGRPSTSRHVA